MLTRRQLLAQGGALAASLALPSSLPGLSGPPSLRKLIDIGPGGVIDPGSAQDYRVASNRPHRENCLPEQPQVAATVQVGSIQTADGVSARASAISEP